MAITKNSISLAGEFAVLSQLSLRGYDANLTLGNTKGVDILLSDPNSSRMLRLEVKTSYNNKPALSKIFGHTLNWMMGEKHETIEDPNLFYCFVNIEKHAQTFRFFIIPSRVVARYVREEHQHWLERSHGEHREVRSTTMRQFRLGLDDGGYAIETPLAKVYENNWEFKE